jgi:protein SCO1
MRYVICLFAVLVGPVHIEAAPLDLAEYRWTQHPGALIPEQVQFRDDSGQAIGLSEISHGLPLILVFGYYHCPNLCGLARSTLLTAIGTANLVAGHDYNLAIVSIDPNETIEDARAAKTTDLAAFQLPGARTWHYLTGDSHAIAALTDAVGYQGRFDSALKQFIHPTGLVLVTPTGAVSSYLLGLGYRPGDLRVALARAGHGAVEAVAFPVILLCFHYDATTGRYTLSILKLLKLAAALTVLTVAGLGLLLFRGEQRT